MGCDITFLTSSREDVTVLAPLETGGAGPLTCLCLGSTGSTAFLARSRRAAAKVDLLLEGAGDTDRWGVWAGGGGPGRPGDGDDGTDWGRTPLERSEMEIKVISCVSVFRFPTVRTADTTGICRYLISHTHIDTQDDSDKSL